MKTYLLSLALCLLMTVPVAAQAPPAPTARHLDRTAPVRSPQVLNSAARSSAISNTVVQLPAIADTYLASERPNENFGGDALFLGFNFFGDRFGAQRILLRFNLDTIPNNARINSAQLRLHLSFASPEDDGPMRTVLRRLASDWDEFSVAWNSEPQWASVRDSTFVGTNSQWYEWEIPDLVQGWVDGSFANHGVEIIGDENIQERERIFYARETSTDLYPQLVVDYDVIDDVSPPVVTVEPLPTYVGRSFTVSWSGSDVGDAGLAYFDVQYRVDGGAWQEWLSAVTRSTEEFNDGQNGRTYEFRARGVDEVGNVEPFGAAEASTLVDSRPPTSSVAPLPTIVDTASFTVSWVGDDGGGSGVQDYDVRYRYNDGPWQLWLSQTDISSAVFNAESDGLYEFEVRARDISGRVEPLSGRAESQIVVDAQPPFVVLQTFLPFAPAAAPAR